MTSQPAYGLTHAYRVGDITGIETLAQALHLMVVLELQPSDISFELHCWAK